MKMSLVMLSNGYLTVQISTLGAELQSIIDKSGLERLWQGDPDFWSGRAPILFPFAGALKDGYFIYGGRQYFLPQHGFARRSEFRLTEQTAFSASFVLDAPNENYPFDYALKVTYALKNDAIRITHEVSNRGAGDMYYALGCHEAYALNSPLHTYRLVFDQKETLIHQCLTGAQLNGDTEPITENSTDLPLRSGLFHNDSLVFQNLNSRGVFLECLNRPERVRVDFDGFDTLLIWKKPHAPFLCIEPWLNPPENVNSDHRLVHKPGIIRLTPGKSNSHEHCITLL